MSDQDRKQDIDRDRDREPGESGGRKPDFIAYNVRETRDGKGFFSRIGAAWQHRDGQGYDIHLDSLPVNGRVSLRELREERVQGYAEERQAEGRSREPSPEHSRDRSR